MGRLIDNRPRLIVSLFAAFVGFAGLFTLPPLDRDEARFAQASAQMLESGDLVTIRFLEEERNKKPAGIHWLQASSVALVSSPEARQIWAYRLPSLLAVITSSLLVFLMGELLFDRRVGLYAGLLFASAPIVAAEATIAKTDAVQLLTICLAQWAIVKTLDRDRASLKVTSLFWSALGASILVKGPIGLLVCGLTLCAMCLKDRSFAPFTKMRPLSGMIILTALILPWAIAINSATEGRFFADAIGGDLLRKVGAAQETHAGPPGYHFVLLFALLWPAAAFLPRAAQIAFSERNLKPWFFLLAWAVPAWVIFELTSTKLPHYTLPLYPAIAIGVAAAINHNSFSTRSAPRLIGIFLYAMIGLMAAAALPLLAHLYGGALTIGIIGGLLIAAGTLGVTYEFITKKSAKLEKTVLSVSAVSAGFAWLMMQTILPSLTDLRVSPLLAETINCLLYTSPSPRDS